MSFLQILKRPSQIYYKPLNRTLASLTPLKSLKYQPKRTMVKKKSTTPGEEYLLLPTPPSTLNIVDTHTHVAPTFEYYRGRYREGKYQTVYDFVRAMYEGRNVESIVDVWCDAPVKKQWKEFADSALVREDRQRYWGGLEYWFVLGTLFFVSILKIEGWLMVTDSMNRCPSVSSLSLYDALRFA